MCHTKTTFSPTFLIFLTVLLCVQNVSGQNPLFGPQQVISTQADQATTVFISDMDGDGDKDVISASWIDDKIAWYENDGTGTFAAEHIITTQANAVYKAISADLDGDGDLDVLGTAATSGTKWYANDGAGNFELAQVLDSDEGSIRAILAADLDGDNDLDIITGSYFSNTVLWYANDGNGVFALADTISEDVSGCIAFDAADMDGDGDLDLISAGNNANKVFLHENLGGGDFEVREVLYDDADEVWDIEAKDMNGNGLIDILIGKQYNAEVGYLRNIGNGSYNYTSISSVPVGVRAIHAVDLDNDGDQDVLSISQFDNGVRWHENIGVNTFASPELISQELQEGRDVYAGDLDGDGDLDVVSASFEDDKIAWYTNQLGEGCMDSGAFNYDPDAWIESGNCCYISGCTNPSALNYMAESCFEDGECLFEVRGIVFYDLNENGIQDEDEIGLISEEVILQPGNVALITNNEGEFLTVVSGSDTYSLSVTQTDLFPYFTSPNMLSFESSEPNWNQDIVFGVTDEFQVFDSDLHHYTQQNGYPCDTTALHTICFNNEGNAPLDIVLEVVLDPLIQGYVEEDLSVDSMSGNQLYLSYQGLLPGECVCQYISFIGPTADYIGDTLEFTIIMEGSFNGEVLVQDSHYLEEIVTCAYDPNDKQVFPNGYSDAHFIQEEETLEYLIRFQNTGNAPATDVIIRDTLDDGLDISTFQLVANSHSVFTTIDPESREVEFYFQDIQLPDSVNNEPESHGLVSFKIDVEAGLPLLTELNNTANIFFDNNPPIVTNTTWSTIYNCSLFEVEFTQDGTLLTASEGDSYQWYMDGNAIAAANDQTYEALETGDYAVAISTNFPCSEITSTIYVVVSSLSEFQGQQVTLFPNPFTQNAILDLGELRGNYMLEIFNLNGQLMRSRSLNIESGILNLERGDLSIGSYLLRLSQGEEFLELQFVVE